MRAVFIWLFIALLPWRLWAADAMAVQHPATPLHATTSLAAHGAHSPCPETRTSANEQAPAVPSATTHVAAEVVPCDSPCDGADPTGGCAETGHDCKSCDLCHNTASLHAAIDWNGPPLNTRQPAYTRQLHLDATRLPGDKPPIT